MNNDKKNNAWNKRGGAKKRKAFTLVELIIVMAVIGILTLLAGPKLMGYTQDARYTKLITTSKELERASERYFMDHEDWPRLTDDAYSAEEIHTFAEKIYDITGKEVTLDPAGNYYDIDYNKLSQYVKVPDDRMHYVLRNPVGKVYALEGLTEIAKDRNFAFNDVKMLINKSNPTTQDSLTWSYETDGEVTEEEWQLDDGVITNTSPNGALPQGPHILRLRLKIENKWTKWNQYEFQVSRIPETFVVNTANSPIVNTSIKYDINDTLTFNYTNADNLIWIVPVSGTYKIDSIAAGAGGKGARVQGEVVLKEGDVLTLKIHAQNNGGGAGGARGTNYYKGINGGNGSGGTLFKLNNNLIIAAGGAGGKGGYGGTRALQGTGGSGGSGGNGGISSGFSGGNGVMGKQASGTGKVGLGGSAVSSGGGKGWDHSVQTTARDGNAGTSQYDGGGGGGGGSIGTGQGSYYAGGGGGGAGGRSFIDVSTILNPVTTPGYNSGNGKVTLKLISK